MVKRGKKVPKTPHVACGHPLSTNFVILGGGHTIADSAVVQGRRVCGRGGRVRHHLQQRRGCAEYRTADRREPGPIQLQGNQPPGLRQHFCQPHCRM